MPGGFGQVTSPSVHSMAADKIAPTWAIGMLLPQLLDLVTTLGDILRVVKNR